MQTVKQICATSAMIPVIEIKELDDAIPIASALCAGGLTTLEITLRTKCALQAIEKIAKELPNALIGAGTMKTPQDVISCQNAGAVFGVSPGAPEKLLAKILENKFPFLPGSATPSEAMNLYDLGFDVLKFFPASSLGGVAMLKSLASPLPHISFCATGGITLENANEYLNLSNVVAIGGSWVLPNEMIKNKDWKGIETLANATSVKLGKT